MGIAYSGSGLHTYPPLPARSHYGIWLPAARRQAIRRLLGKAPAYDEDSAGEAEGDAPAGSGPLGSFTDSRGAAGKHFGYQVWYGRRTWNH